MKWCSANHTSSNPARSAASAARTAASSTSACDCPGNCAASSSTPARIPLMSGITPPDTGRPPVTLSPTSLAVTAVIAGSCAAGSADAGELDHVLNFGEAVAPAGCRRPAFHGRGGHDDAAPAVPADQVVLVAAGRAQPEQLAPARIAGAVQQPGPGEGVQGAVDGGQPDPVAGGEQPGVQDLRGDKARIGSQAA